MPAGSNLRGVMGYDPSSPIYAYYGFEGIGANRYDPLSTGQTGQPWRPIGTQYQIAPPSIDANGTLSFGTFPNGKPPQQPAPVPFNIGGLDATPPLQTPPGMNLAQMMMFNPYSGQ